MIQVSKYVYRGFPGVHVSSLEAFAREGGKRALDLETGTADRLHHYDYEERTYGVAIVRVPLSNYFPASRAQAKQIAGLLKQEVTTLVFCFSNVDRTGEAILFHRVLNEGVDFETAWAEMVRMGMHWWFTWWKPFLKWACK